MAPANDCFSCKEGQEKKGLTPHKKKKLPIGITDAPNFRHPKLATYVCPHCDGEDLIRSALKAFSERDK